MSSAEKARNYETKNGTEVLVDSTDPEGPTFLENVDIKKSLTLADISKAKRMLGYSPEYNFEKGLGEAINWYKRNL